MRSRFLIFVCVLGVCLVGCGHVSPYEREHLSRPCMDRSERDAAKGRFVAHLYDAREGAMGTTENAGGGCGCN